MIGAEGGLPTAPMVCSTLGRRHELVSNAVLAFNHSLCQYTVCLGYSWILINVDKKYFKKSKNSEKIKP